MLKTIPQSKSQDRFTLFNKTISVLYVGKDELKLSKVVLSKTPKIVKQFSVVFNYSNLKDTLQSLLSKLNAKSVYLLLGRDLAYVVRFTIPMHIQGSEERGYVFKKMSEIVPEVLDDNDWDYKEISLGKEEKEVLVFAVVKEKFKILDEIIQSLSIDVNAIEPEEISVLRNENPIIGIALKDDTEGKDNKSLNIELGKKKSNLSPVVIFGWIVVSTSALILTLLLDMVFRGWLY